MSGDSQYLAVPDSSAEGIFRPPYESIFQDHAGAAHLVDNRLVCPDVLCKNPGHVYVDLKTPYNNLLIGS